MRMIIADDEPVIIRGLKKLVDWEALGIELVGEYEDGKRAFEGIVKKRPDLALLDISMPGMTGVEILKEVRKMELPTRIIFVSGFQDFEYAKAALKYGAVDYLLKPIIREELINAVEKCLPKPPAVEKEEQRQADYGKLVEIEETSYVPVFAEVLLKREESGPMEKLLRFSLTSFLEEYLEERSLGIIFTRRGNTVVVLKGLERSACIPVLEDMQMRAKEATGHRVAFALGREVQTMGEIPEAFEECLKMKDYFFFADQKQVPVFSVGGPVFAPQPEVERLNKAREELLDALMAQEEELSQKRFEQYGRLVCRMADGKKEDACFYLCSLARRLGERIQELGLIPSMEETKTLLERARDCADYGEMLEFFWQVLKGELDTIRRTVVSNDKKDIIRAKEYIEEHYRENLNLNILADEIHMNPSYFSSFFKKNAGENFKDYVNRVRIRHAVSLLLSTDKKTYEIAQEVGFSDARTFSDIFQRFYNETPNAYRKRIQKTEE